MTKTGDVIEGTLPCPFCGQVPSVTEDSITIDGVKIHSDWQVVHRCAALARTGNELRAFIGVTPEEAVRNWNRRA